MVWKWIDIFVEWWFMASARVPIGAVTGPNGKIVTWTSDEEITETIEHKELEELRLERLYSPVQLQVGSLWIICWMNFDCVTQSNPDL